MPSHELGHKRKAYLLEIKNWPNYFLPILFVDNGMTASCLKVQQMVLVNIARNILPPILLLNLTQAPSVGYPQIHRENK